MISEANAFAWCLQNPAEFWLLSEQFRPDQFKTEPWSRLWKPLLQGFREHDRWPELSELPAILNGAGMDSVLRLRAEEMLKGAYTAPVSTYTRSDLVRWLAVQEFASIGSELINAESSKHTVQQMIEHHRERLNKLERMSAGEKALGERYSPMDNLENWSVDLDDSYGGQPVPTGIYRLDRKLRYGGIRPTLVLIVGPSGGGKTTTLLSIEAACVRAGGRVVHYSNDDSKGDLKERWFGHVLRRPLTWEDRTDEARKLDIQKKLIHAFSTEYCGRWEGIELEPDRDTPKAILQDLRRLQKEFWLEDQAWVKSGGGYIPEEDWGKIDLVGIDSGDQMKSERQYKESWLELEKLCVQAAHIPKAIGCPLILSIQGNQETVGATQITSRNIGGAYGKIKPAKLVIGVAQTVAQSQSAITIDQSSEFFKLNREKMWAFHPQLDANVEWQSASLCIIKNTMAEARAGLVRNVMLPILIDFATCRMVEDFSQPESLMRAPSRTLQEEREATGGAPPVAATGKRGKKA